MWHRRALLGAIVAAGLGVRIVGVDFGLPRLYHPDEPQYVLQALAVGQGLPNGLTFANPPLYKYVLLSEFGGVYVLDRLRGQDFAERFRGEPARLYLLARVTSALLGAATVLAVAALGTVVANGRVGLRAAAFAAATYLLVRESHFGVNDALVTLLTTLALVPIVRLARRGDCTSVRDYVLSGALIGLAFAAKYQALALLVPLVLARRPTRGLAVGLVSAAVAAIIAFPSLVAEPTRVASDIYEHLYLGARNGYDGLDPAGGYLFYAQTLALGLGAPLLIASIASIAAKRDRTTVVLASLPITMFLALGAQQMYFARFVLPALPSLIVLAAVAIDRLLAVRMWLGVLATLIVVAPTLVDSIRFDLLLTRTDARTLASQWVAANLPNDARIAVDAPPLGPTLDLTTADVANDGALYDHPLSTYRDRGDTYVVTTSFVADARAIDARRETLRTAFDADLRASAEVLAMFRPYQGDSDLPFAYDRIYGPFDHLFNFERPGPTVMVYRLTR